MKRILSVLAALSIASCLFGAAPAVHAYSYNKPVIEDVDYEGNGRVEVDFDDDVAYGEVHVAVKDTRGRKYTATVSFKDDDELNFRVNNIKAGKTYRFTISGIKNKHTGSYTSISGQFAVPRAGSVVIKRIEYDAEDGELSVDFKQKVRYKNAKATVKDPFGNTFASRIVDKDSDDMEIRVSGLAPGGKYIIAISGVANRNGGSYKTISKTFYAWDD